MTVLTGAKTRVNAQWESSYKTLDGTASLFMPLANASLDTAEATNNGERVTLPGSNVAVSIEPGTFAGAWAISGWLVDPWLFGSVYGSPTTTDNTDGSHTHVYSLGEPDSFQIFEGYETSTTAERTFEGCVTARAVIDPSVGQASGIPALFEGFYATESVSTGVTLKSQDTTDEEVLHYGDLTLKRGGSAESIVQDASLELAWDPIEPVQAFGSRFALDFVAGLFTPTINYTKLKQDAAALQDVYGGSTSMQEDISTAKVELNADNGVSPGSGINKALFEGSGDSFPESYGDSAGDPRTPIEENLDRLIENIDVKWTNEVASAP